MQKSEQEEAVTRQRITKEAAAAFRKNGIAGTGLSDMMATVVCSATNYCPVVKDRE
jgi:AcrR family transcriptional regulator